MLAPSITVATHSKLATFFSFLGPLCSVPLALNCVCIFVELEILDWALSKYVKPKCMHLMLFLCVLH